MTSTATTQFLKNHVWIIPALIGASLWAFGYVVSMENAPHNDSSQTLKNAPLWSAFSTPNKLKNELTNTRHGGHYGYDYQARSRGFQQVGYSTKFIGKETAFGMLNDMNDVQLAGYLEGMVPKPSELARVDNRAFATRVLSELFTPAHSTREAGLTEQPISITADKAYTAQDMDLTRIDADTRLYAHIKTDDSVPHGGRIVIKWQHIDSGEMLLFNMKYINANSPTNWVSFTPADGWLAGDYVVAYYLFDTELTPVAKRTFHIGSVVHEDDDDDIFFKLGISPEDVPSGIDELENAQQKKSQDEPSHDKKQGGQNQSNKSQDNEAQDEHPILTWL